MCSISKVMFNFKNLLIAFITVSTLHKLGEFGRKVRQRIVKHDTDASNCCATCENQLMHAIATVYSIYWHWFDKKVSVVSS
jgi:hypothetical protein